MTIFDTPFIKVKEAKTEKYFYSERKGVDSVAFILNDNISGSFGFINERKPPLDERISEDIDIPFKEEEAFLETAFGGSNDGINMEEYFKMNEEERISHFKKTVIAETREEAGYEITEENIEFVSKVFVSTQQNQFCYLFLVDITGKESFEPEYENSTEAKSNVVWKTLDEAFETQDWKAKTILGHKLFEFVKNI
jgi:hypothetical protein